MKTVVVGVDQSYQRSGVSVAVDGKLMMVTSISYAGMESKTEKRNLTRQRIEELCRHIAEKFDESTTQLVLVLERTRQFSDGFLSVPYIKSMGALNASIIDIASSFGFSCWSVDTRAWKSAVVGTSKPLDNKFGINPKKWPTILWLINRHPEFKQDVMVEASKRARKGVLTTKSGKRFLVNDDACDSAAIALSWFLCTPDKFMAEE